ncbi:MAG: calcium-binding protein, partial [Dolichospermum sp.]
MNPLLLSNLPAIYDILFNFAQSDGFWANWQTAFGTSYDVVKATQLRQQWQSRNFGQIPPIEVLSDEILGTANGAYSSSTNKIYLSASFLNTASSASIVNVILEEIGHYVDAQINQVDSAGDEGAIFAELVQGNSLDVATLDALRAENDQTTIIVNGEIIQVEQADFTGTNGNDNITGTSGDDRIYGLGGNDTLSGLGGQDRLEGGDGDDLLSGGAGNDSDYTWYQYAGLYGGDGNDTINGEAGNDQLYGGNNNDILQGTNNGTGEQDYLEGGTGSDRFILADTTKTFYDDGLTATEGTSDYAEIADFSTIDDTIQLRGASSDYLLTVSGSTTNLYINKPGNEADELIAYISNQTALSLTASYFSY